jgi:hypothetical protein
VIVHEWSHVQRRDDLVNLFQLAARALAGWHPAVWWLHRRLLIEREVACDEMVVAMTGSAKEYASSLARVASLAPNGRLSLASVGALSSSGLTMRVLRILASRKTLTNRWAAAALAASGVVLAFLSLAVAGFHPIGPAQPAPLSDPPRPATAAAASDVLLESARTRVPLSTERFARRSANSAPLHRVATGQPPIASEPIIVETVAVEIPAAQGIPDRAPQPELIATSLPVVSSTLRSSELTRQSGPAQADTDASSPQQPGSPWAAAAGAGAAIGRGSQKAGLATASFFTRIGKKIGNSF